MNSSGSKAKGPRIRVLGRDRTGTARRLSALAPQLRLVAKENADLVLLPAADFERLQDAAEDRSAKRAFERSRHEEFVPIDLADRLLKRESPVRVWRKHRGFLLAELASRAGLSKSYLSDIENGKRVGTIATLRSIAKVLNVDVDDLASTAAR